MPESTQTLDSALCRHFGECGGCQHQDLPYARQIEAKARALADLFAPFWTDPVPVDASPVQWHYRNKVDLAFGRKHYPEPPPKGFERESVLGFKKKGRWFWPLEVEECLIAPEGIAPLLDSVRAWMRDRNLKAFDSRSRQGFLRILLVREGKRTGQRMVVLVTSAGELDRDGFVNAVQSSYPADSLYWAVFNGLADVAAADELELLHGSPVIDEVLALPGSAGMRELRFRLSPFSFFQTNTLATEHLYTRIREWAAAARPTMLYDLYGGAGGIAFTCADLVDHVESVESVESATHDGLHNATVNGIENVRFTTAQVEHYLRGLRDAGGMHPGAAVVLDPPRAGLHPKALKRLLEMKPRNILYVSCKPSVLAGELPAFLEHYRLESLRAVDLFPHTPHVEVLAQLTAISG